MSYYLMTPMKGSSTLPPFIDEVSLNFNGTNAYVDMGNNLSFDRATPFTLSLWIYFTADSPVGGLIQKTDGASGSFRGYTIEIVAGQVFFVLRSVVGSNEAYIMANNTILPNAWTHIVCTYDGSSTAAGLNMYFNGSLAPSTIGADTLTTTFANSISFTLGANSLAGFFYAGLMDEVTVWNSALSAGNINTLYDGGAPNNPTFNPASSSLVSWWRMGDSPDTFSTLVDQVGTNNGTTVNITAGDLSSNVPT